MTIDQFVKEVRRLRPHLPAVLSPEKEARTVAILQPWWNRLAEARERYAFGQLPAEPFQRAMSTAYAHTPLTDEEREAAFDALAMTAPMVAEIVTRQARRAIWQGAIETGDALGDAIDLFLKSMSTFVPGRGRRLSTWLHGELSRNAADHFRRYSPPTGATFTNTDDLEYVTDTTAGDVEDLLDWDAWAKTISASVPGFGFWYATLSGDLSAAPDGRSISSTIPPIDR